MTASQTTQSTDEETDESNEQQWEYADAGHALEAPATRRAVVSGGVAASTAERLHEDLTVVTEARARRYEEYRPEVRLGVECDRIDERLSISVELDADEARDLARSLEDAAREAEEIVVEERVHALEGEE